MGVEITTAHSSTKLYIGPIPGRKREAICIEEGSVITIVAYLGGEEQREHLLAALRSMLDLVEPGTRSDP